ncbi:hypothetical protein LY76DRAFT_599696, partial [Colletotrichum caudatum]
DKPSQPPFVYLATASKVASKRFHWSPRRHRDLDSRFNSAIIAGTSNHGSDPQRLSPTFRHPKVVRAMVKVKSDLAVALRY